MPAWLAPVLSAAGVGLTNIFNAGMANRQMQFQKDMASTAYQRSRADMLRAGMNPYMAHSMGGAQSGSGASAQMGDALGAGVSSALSSQLMKAQIAKTNAEARSAQADADLKDPNLVLGPGDFSYREDVMSGRAARVRDNRFGSERNEFERDTWKWRRAMQPIDQERAELELKLRGLDVNEAQAYSGYYGRTGWKGILAEKGARVAGDLAGAVGSVGGVVNGARAAKRAADAVSRRSRESGSQAGGVLSAKEHNERLLRQFPKR